MVITKNSIHIEFCSKTRDQQREIEEISQKLKDQKVAFEEEKKKSDSLKKLSDVLSKKYEEQKNFEALEIERKPELVLDEKTMMKWRKLTRNQFNFIRHLLEVKDQRYTLKPPTKLKEKEKIEIKLSHNFVLQKFFDVQSESDNERQPSTSTFLFRDLHEKRVVTSLSKKLFKDDDEESIAFRREEGERVAKNYYAYKILLDWNVKYDGELFILQFLHNGSTFYHEVL